MHSLRSACRGSTAAILLAVLAMLFVSALSALRAPPASAQSYSCAGGLPLIPTTGQACTQGYSSCGAFVFNGCTPFGSTYGCTGNIYTCGSTYGCGVYAAACPSNVTCSGYYYSCTGAGAFGCGSSLFAVGCSGARASGCTGIPLQVGQSCANGVLTCTSGPAGIAVPCSATGISGCPPTVTTPQCVRQTVANSITVTASTNPVPPSSQVVSCPGGGFAPAGQTCPTPAPSPGQPAGSPTASATSAGAAQSSGFQVSIAAGWNLIAGPGGTTIGNIGGSLFTYGPADTAYEILPVSGTLLRAGQGYWLYTGQAAEITLVSSIGSTVRTQLPAGKWVMIGNPGTSNATVTGADTVLTYDAGTSKYTQSSQLLPGQGAWATSNNGGTATITNDAAGQH